MGGGIFLRDHVEGNAEMAGDAHGLAEHLRLGDRDRRVVNLAGDEGLGGVLGKRLGGGQIEEHLPFRLLSDAPIDDVGGLAPVEVFVDADGDGACFDGACAELFP